MTVTSIFLIISDIAPTSRCVPIKPVNASAIILFIDNKLQDNSPKATIRLMPSKTAKGYQKLEQADASVDVATVQASAANQMTSLNEADEDVTDDDDVMAGAQLDLDDATCFDDDEIDDEDDDDSLSCFSSGEIGECKQRCFGRHSIV